MANQIQLQQLQVSNALSIPTNQRSNWHQSIKSKLVSTPGRVNSRIPKNQLDNCSSSFFCYQRSKSWYVSHNAKSYPKLREEDSAVCSLKSIPNLKGRPKKAVARRKTLFEGRRHSWLIDNAVLGGSPESMPDSDEPAKTCLNRGGGQVRSTGARGWI